MRIFLIFVLALLWHAPAFAIATNVANTLSSCGTAGYAPNHDAPLTVNLLGELCINGSGGGGGGTSSNFGDPFPTAGTAAGFKNPSNNMAPATLNADGGLEVHLLNGGSGGTSSTFGAAFPTLGTAGGMSDGTNMVPFKTTDGTSLDVNVTGSSLPTGAATEASLAKLTLAQGSSTSGQSGTLNLGAVTTSAPTYTNGQSSPLSMTTGGLLRVDGSGATQPISGSVTANAGTNLNTSALALESGGNLATLAGVVTSSRAAVNLISGQSGVAGGSGTVGATTQRVTLATDVPLPAGTNTIGVVNVAPPTSGGLSVSRAVLANSTNATVVKASAGQLYSISAFSISSATPAWIKFYNTSSSPTCNSSTVVAGPFLIPANNLGAGLSWNNTLGLAFSTGISYCVTTGIADNDNTAVAASTYTVTIGYK